MFIAVFFLNFHFYLLHCCSKSIYAYVCFRETPSMYICQYLMEEAALISIYDPKVDKKQILR